MFCQAQFQLARSMPVQYSTELYHHPRQVHVGSPLHEWSADQWVVEVAGWPCLGFCICKKVLSGQIYTAQHQLGSDFFKRLIDTIISGHLCQKWINNRTMIGVISEPSVPPIIGTLKWVMLYSMQTEVMTF